MEDTGAGGATRKTTSIPKKPPQHRGKQEHTSLCSQNRKGLRHTRVWRGRWEVRTGQGRSCAPCYRVWLFRMDRVEWAKSRGMAILRY